MQLWPHQWDAVFNIDAYRFVALIGGRGSGKSYMDTPRVLRWSEMITELPIGIFAATNELLMTVLAPIVAMVDELGLKTVYAAQAPKKWRKRWKRDGVPFPPRRLRNGKFWIWEDGTHIFTCSLINNAYTRAKSIDFNAILIQEGTEPGVTEEAIDTLFPTLRCGKATVQPDGSRRCVEPGHLHQLVFCANVPLRNPSHWIYKKVERLQTREEQRKADGERPFFRLITSSTMDNPSTGDDYVEALRAALDEDTFREQTSGSLERNRAALSYYAFSDANILPTLRYDPKRALHMWFDFNTKPAVAGWGHDLFLEEVPESHVRGGYTYFGMNGELFTGPEPMVTEQVAYALLEDPQRHAFGEARCIDCGCEMKHHVQMKDWICRRCNFRFPDGAFCTGGVKSIEAGAKRYLHLGPGSLWRGLMRHRGEIFIYGDATGKATHADGAVDEGGAIRILRDVIMANMKGREDHIHFRFKKHNPPIRLRVLAMNRKLCDAHGVRSFYLPPWCEAHIDDFREVVPDENDEPKKENFSEASLKRGGYCLRTHSSDGAGYFVDERWPAVIPKANRLPLMGGTGSLGPLENQWSPP